MTESRKQISRRELGKQAGAVAAASALASVAIPHVFAAGDDLIQLALIGAGGRGTGAAGDAMSVSGGPIKLVAMADVFDGKLNNSFNSLTKSFPKQVDVGEKKFLGFDAYKKAMDCLKPGDIAILTTPPAFRWVMYKYAIEKGLNVFMEKPVTVDGPSSKKMLAINEEAKKKNLKVGVGLMCRHCKSRQELAERIKAGEIGDIVYFRSYRMGGRAANPGKYDAAKMKMSETLYQIRSFHAFLWASGGLFSDYNIHQIDECSMMKDAWPVRAHAVGARHFRGESVDQNLDVYSVELVYADGVRMFFDGRHQDGARSEFASYAHGTKNSAVVSTHVHTPAKCRIYKGHMIDSKENLLWAFPQPEPNPYRVEWVDLVDAVRNGKQYNEVERGVQASVVTSMARMAAHTGQTITYDEMLNCPHEFAPDVDKMTADSPAPLVADKDGKYPVPEPGKKKLEY